MSVDKTKVAQRFARAVQTYDQQAVVQQHIAQHLAELIGQFCLEPLPRIFEIGCGSGALTRQLLQQQPDAQFLLNDLYPQVQQHFSDLADLDWYLGDIERIVWPQQVDAIVSSSALQWMTDLDAVLQHCAQVLNPSGFLCFSIFGAENLSEIKVLTGQGLNYFALETLRQKVQEAGFDILYLEQAIETLHFSHPRAVLQHLKATGVTATNHGYRWSKHSLQKFYQEYHKFAQTDIGGNKVYPLTYHPIYCIARRSA